MVLFFLGQQSLGVRGFLDATGVVHSFRRSLERQLIAQGYVCVCVRIRPHKKWWVASFAQSQIDLIYQ